MCSNMVLMVILSEPFSSKEYSMLNASLCKEEPVSSVIHV